MTDELSVAAADERLAAAVLELAERARTEGVAARLAAGDPTLWGPEAEPEAKLRLGWLDLDRTSRELLPRLAALRAELAAAGIDRVVLAGMGGSSLAPEVICRTAGVPLVVLDTTDPGQVAAALADDLDRTVVVVSSKSGGTVETDSHRRAAWAAFEAAGIDPGPRFVAVTAPLLEQAAGLRDGLAEPDHNPALDLGLALGAAATVGRDKIVLTDTGSGLAGFGDWAEQLIAESTGKHGTGLLPVVVEGPLVPGTSGPDVAVVTIGPPGDAADPVASVAGPLGAQFLAWEYGVAVAGWVLGINPFDQAAQAAGDRQALAGRDRPLLHLHLTDRAAGLGQLLEAVP